MSTFLRLASRAKALLLTDADEVFEGMARRRRRRFHQHPLRMHVLHIAGTVLSFLFLWYVAGLKPVLVFLGLWLCVFALNALVVVARRLRQR